MIQKLQNSVIKNVFKDFILNFIASIVVTGVSQLLLYPLLAKYMSANGYGLMLTLMGIANTIATACGGSLNNARLLLNTDYEETKSKGDFPILLLVMVVFTGIGLAFVLGFLYAQHPITIILLILFTVLCLLRSYFSVEYRLILNYKKILINNISIVAGNLLGISLFILLKQEILWPLPFVGGECIGFLYLLISTQIIAEPLAITGLFKKTLSKEVILMASSLSANVLTYLDRLLLLPLLGGTAVSIYTVASVFGKTLGILMIPLAGVLLGYYAQKGFLMGRKLFWKINFFTLAAGGIFTVGSMIFAPWFTSLLYPSLIAEAKPYILIANITAIVSVVGNMIQPSVLKFTPTFWQLIIQIIYMGIYLLAGMAAAKTIGLWGFSIAALAASLIKLMLLCLIGHIFINGETVSKE